MALDRRYGYVEGNNVRTMQPVERPERRQNPGRDAGRHAKQESVHYVNIFYAFFLTAAACMVLWSCVHYLQLQEETTSRVKNIASLETSLEELRKLTVLYEEILEKERKRYETNLKIGGIDERGNYTALHHRWE